jgi:hypothetical protein
MIIIACSLFVGGLTSGLTNLISIFGNHWIAPAFSFTVSFLTAMVTLFRPRERGYNLQQTADAIQFEIDCANRRIYGYKDMNDREAYTKLAEEVEKDAISNVVYWRIAEKAGSEVWTGFNAFTLHIITQKSIWHLFLHGLSLFHHGCLAV